VVIEICLRLGFKGREGFVRFPVEAILDAGGDCENLVILIAAILHEMDYDELLLLCQTRIALIIIVNDGISGICYNYKRTCYYYLESTNFG
jgi:hypothetical protein